MSMRTTIAIMALGLGVAVWRAATLAAAPAPEGASAAVHTRPAASAAAGITQPAHATATAPPSSHASRASPAGAPAAASLAKVEAAVREARRKGKGEQEVHRLRATQLPAAQVEELARMEAAEVAWQLRLEALKAACAANIGCDDARASFTPAELQRVTAYTAPTLRQ